jgi:hypothetical protein
MKLLFASILIIGLATVACGKKKSTAPEAATPSTAAENVAAPDSSAEPVANEPAPRPRRTAPAPIPQAVQPQARSVDEALIGAVHTFMTAQLKKFIEEQGRMPKDFSEFASSRMDSVPRPPAGMKFVIDETTRSEGRQKIITRCERADDALRKTQRLLISSCCYLSLCALVQGIQPFDSLKMHMLMRDSFCQELHKASSRGVETPAISAARNGFRKRLSISNGWRRS